MNRLEGMSKNKLVIGLGIATGAALLLLVGFLARSWWDRSPGPGGDESKKESVLKPGDKVERSEMPNPPPAPQPVKDTVRAQQVLKPGKTYLTTSKMAFSMRGTDRDWGLATTVTISYWAQAEVERKIEANDGRTIVELRTFKEISSKKVTSTLEDIHIDLGPTGDFILGGILLVQPEAAPLIAGYKALQGRNLAQWLGNLGLTKNLVDRAEQSDPTIKAALSAGSLQGKTVRLKYQNDAQGDIQVQPVSGGDLNVDEQRFLASSVLLADALIFPNTEIKKGDSWQVESMYFMGLIDPSLLARPEGTVRLERGEDEIVPLVVDKSGKLASIYVRGGELRFHESNSKNDSMGFFRPEEGKLLFSPTDQIFVSGRLKGRGKLTVRSKDHVMFEARSDREPVMTIEYKCSILDRK